MSSSVQVEWSTPGVVRTAPPAAAVVTPPSLRRSTMSHHTKQRSQYYYIVVTLERASKTSPWGMSLRRTNDDSYSVGDSIRSTVRNCWMVQSDTCVHTEQIRTAVLPQFVQALFRETPIYTSSITCGAAELIQPGDIILSVGGTPMREFAQMQDFQEFVRKAPTNLLQWVLRRDVNPTVAAAPANTGVVRQLYHTTAWTPPPPLPIPKNPLFRDDTKDTPLTYQDDPYDPDDGTRAQLFLAPMAPNWLTVRKRHWRTLYTVFPVGEQDVEDTLEWDDSTVARDFWTPQGFPNLQSWISARTQTWAASYSWNRDKRRRLKIDCQQSVDMNEDFSEWLRVRKNQWRIQRRKRQRTNLIEPPKEMLMIDEIIAEEEQQKQAMAERTPLDISFIFDAALGCPDDVVCKLFRNLRPVEQLRLLQINTTTRQKLIQRENLWRMLCPSHWQLPRRPRKPWYMIYHHNLRIETEASRKQWDDLLSKASQCLLSGDLLGAVEKLVTDAEHKFEFNVNYASGVVCERNALLNLAVIHQRHRVVRWLVEVKRADIETCDRGNFTPLLNAAWAGDKYLVRYLMQQGANRTTIGRFHYTKPVAPLDFTGHTAEGWAAERGHAECARLLALGL